MYVNISRAWFKMVATQERKKGQLMWKLAYLHDKNGPWTSVETKAAAGGSEILLQEFCKTADLSEEAVNAPFVKRDGVTPRAREGRTGAFTYNRYCAHLKCR